MTALLATELRLLSRGGFWAAYAVICAAYLLLLHTLPDALFDVVLPILVFADPAVLGLWVVGSMVLLERREGALQALAHTPTAPGAWIGAKITGLTVLAVVVAVVVAAGSGALVRPDLLLLAVVPTSALSVLLGIAVVSRASTFNRFLALASVATAPLAVPAFELLFDVTIPGAAWIPTAGTVDLLLGAFGAPITALDVAGDLLLIAAGCGLAAWWAGAWTQRYLWRRA